MHAADGRLRPRAQFPIPYAQAVSTSVILGLLVSFRRVVGDAANGWRRMACCSHLGSCPSSSGTDNFAPHMVIRYRQSVRLAAISLARPAQK